METIEQLREEVRVKTKIIAEIKKASEAGIARRQAVETDARDMAVLIRAAFHGHRWRREAVRASTVRALQSIAERVLSRK